MAGRRRPRQHIRRTDGNAIIVNRGVEHSDETTGITTKGLNESLSQLTDVTFDDVRTLEREHLPLRISLTTARRPVKGVTMRRRNLFRQRSYDTQIIDTDLQGSVLDNSRFNRITFRDVDLSNTSLRDVEMLGCSLDNVSMRGADLTGLSFESSYPREGVLDLTDSNVTKEQIKSLKIESKSPSYVGMFGKKAYVLYRQYTPADIVEKFDVDKESVKVLLWGSNVECRHNDTYQLVEWSDFDPERHHIPQWEVAELGLTPR